MNIFYVIFGDKLEYHIQAYLSIRSFQKQANSSDKIFVMTTKPELYRNSGVDIIPIDEETIHEWKGEYGFFWRVKIKAMEYMHNHYPNDHLLYLDTDTFLYGRLDELKKRFDRGEGIMHKDEGHPSSMKTKSKRMWIQVGGKIYANISLGQQHHMYNAGVVGIPKNKIEAVVSTALSICDTMLAENVERVVIEQYSLSISLFENTILTEGLDCIGHYWGNKLEWEHFASEMIIGAYMKKQTLLEEISLLDTACFTRMPIYIYHSNTARRLCNLIKWCFKDKEIIYI